MKKIFLPAACAALFFASCNMESKTDAAGNSTLRQKNLDASHIVVKAFETGDVSNIDSAVASDFVDHTDKGDANRDSLKAMIKWAHEHDKDMKMETVKEVADDDYVFSLMHYTGTSDGSMGPAGPYDMHSIEVVRCKDGKAVEHWAYMESGEMMKMMQKMQGMDKMGMGKDTSKMKK